MEAKTAMEILGQCSSVALDSPTGEVREAYEEVANHLEQMNGLMGEMVKRLVQVEYALTLTAREIARIRAHGDAWNAMDVEETAIYFEYIAQANKELEDAKDNDMGV